jgi:hypothetical protein
VIRFAAAIAAVGLAIPTTTVAQPTAEAYLAGAVSRHTSPVGDGTLGGITLGFAVGTPTLVAGPELVLRTGDSLRVRAFAIAARLRQGGGWIHPHLVVSLGAYSWQRAVPPEDRGALPPGRSWREVTYFSGALGGGVTVGPWRGTVTGMVEARWHRNIQQNRAEGSRSLVGIEAGLHLWW